MKFQALSAFIIVMIGVITVVSGGNEVSLQEDRREFEKATFAGGCFWCMQSAFDHLDGVIATTVGFTGGKEAYPSYEEVSTGRTGHREAIEIVYDPLRISYEQLVDVFWKNIDPTQADGQFVDIGTQYRTAIFYHDQEQKRVAEQSRKRLQESGKFKKKIVTDILPADHFYPAEEYHQKFYEKNPLRYHYYRLGSGREQFIRQKWGEQRKDP